MQQTRRSGSLFLCTFACLALTATVVRAHDPGLSSLDVTVSRGEASASLSLAAADVALAASSRGVDAKQALTALARDAIRLSMNGETVPPIGDDVTIDDGGARIRLFFRLPNISDRTVQLAVRSDVPTRLARGHRELLTVKAGSGPATERLLDAESGPVVVDLEAASHPFARAWSFLALGVHHILTGYDHLVFLAGLILAACTLRQLLIALTAFTVAHSVSLALVVLGGVHAPPSIVEPLIAASIAWVGVENLLGERHRARWLLVFGFGLIHGFGFAGALMDLGFGSSVSDVATALLSFNGGVEMGQLAAASAMLPLVWVIRSRPAWQARVVPVCSTLIAVAGGYWLFQRLT